MFEKSRRHSPRIRKPSGGLVFVGQRRFLQRLLDPLNRPPSSRKYSPRAASAGFGVKCRRA